MYLCKTSWHASHKFYNFKDFLFFFYLLTKISSIFSGWKKLLLFFLLFIKQYTFYGCGCWLGSRVTCMQRGHIQWSKPNSPRITSLESDKIWCQLFSLLRSTIDFDNYLLYFFSQIIYFQCETRFNFTRAFNFLGP